MDGFVLHVGVVRTEFRRGPWGAVSNPDFNTLNARSPQRLQCLCKTGHAQWPQEAAEKVCRILHVTCWNRYSVGAGSRKAWSYPLMVINAFPIRDYQTLLDVYH